MNQICRKMKKFGSVMLAMLMAVSIFDANLIFAQDEATGNVKLTQTCDHENIKPNENGELLIPWNDTIATTSSEFVSFSNYEAEMKEHQHATPDTFQLQITEETGGETRTLVEGTDFALFYFNPTNELYTDKKDEIETFQKFKVDFLKKDKTFYAINIKYQTVNEITTLKETEENRQFDIEGTWNADEPIKATGTYVYSNPNYKVVEEEPVKEEINVSNEIKDHENQKNEVNQITSNKTSKTVSNGEEPTSPYGTYPERYKVWDFTTAEEHKDDHYNSIVGNQYKYGDFGERTDYNIFYILANYNAFTFNDYTGSHVVGPMAVGRTLNLTGNIGGVTKDPNNPYHHTVPTVLDGYIKGNLNLVTESDVPVFIGVEKSHTAVDDNSNQEVQDAKLNAEKKPIIRGEKDKQYVNYYFAESSHQYIDFNHAKTNILNEMQKFNDKNYSGVDAAGHQIKTIVIKKELFDKAKSTGMKTMSDDQNYWFEKSSDNGGRMGLRLKLGYNYVFEEGIIGNINYLVYDYENFEEASTQTTLLNMADASDKSITFPHILKSKSDKLGGGDAAITVDPAHGIEAAYDFSSSEVEKAFNIVYMLPNVKDLLINKHLAGHLVAPNANVSIRCGDYNGGVIAESVDSTSEGHMWPFKLDGSISFDKTVNGDRPESDEKFTFRLKNVYKPEGSKEIGEKIAQNNVTGKVFFSIDSLESEGDYLFEITEDYPGPGYAANNEKYYAYLSVEHSDSELGGGKLIPVFKGFYKKYSTSFGNLVLNENDKIENLVINNIREFGVEKKWQDQNGDAITDTSSLPNVNGVLMQKYVEDVGSKVTVNVYGIHFGDVNPENKKLIETKKVNGYVKKDGTYQVELKLRTHDSVIDVDVSGEGYTSVNKDDKTLISIANVNTDLVVDITIEYHADNTNGIGLDLLEEDEENKKNIASNPISGELEYTKFTLNNDNKWYQGFDKLPSSGEVKGQANKRFKFTYYVKEENIPGFDVSYSTTDGIACGVITITNKAKPSDLKIQKVSSTGNNKHLEGAIFQLQGKNNELIKFKQSDKKYEYDTSGNVTDLISNSDGLVNLSNLPVGDYVLVETKAPDGFVIEYKEIPIHIDYDKYKSYYKLGDKETKFFNQQSSTDTEVGKIEYQFTVENIPDIKVPETGGTPGNPYQKIGFLIACCGFAMFAMYEYKRHKNIEESKN